MNVEVINPFINSVLETLEAMIGVTPDREAPYLKNSPRTQYDVTGVIGFIEEDLHGSIALSFPSRTAINIYNLIKGKGVTKMTREVQDLVGELTNIVANNARKILTEAKLSFHISVPTLVIGRNHAIRHQLNIPVVVVPFRIEDDSFMLEVSMKIQS
ncbi:MAG TPA: chemotaxis protein CheX [Bacteroidetes bacterium]|nr:chemotaxis protein CheX [Bacteroidota bacterium]